MGFSFSSNLRIFQIPCTLGQQSLDHAAYTPNFWGLKLSQAHFLLVSGAVLTAACQGPRRWEPIPGWASLGWGAWVCTTEGGLGDLLMGSEMPLWKVTAQVFSLRKSHSHAPLLRAHTRNSRALGPLPPLGKAASRLLLPGTAGMAHCRLRSSCKHNVPRVRA